MKVIDSVNELISNNELKHKHHPGISKPRQVEQPSWLAGAVRDILYGNKLKKICCISLI